MAQNIDYQKLTVTVVALGNTTLDRDTSALETQLVLFRSLWPSAFHHTTLSLGAEIVSNVVLLVNIALEVHESERIGDILLLEDNSG